MGLCFFPFCLIWPKTEACNRFWFAHALQLQGNPPAKIYIRRNTHAREGLCWKCSSFAAFLMASVSTQQTEIIYEHFQSANDYTREHLQSYSLYTPGGYWTQVLKGEEIVTCLRVHLERDYTNNWLQISILWVSIARLPHVFHSFPYSKGYSARWLVGEVWRSLTQRNKWNWTMGSIVTWVRQM